MKKQILLLWIVISFGLFAQNLVREQEVGPGVKFKIYLDSDKPLYITVLEADLANPLIDVRVGLANDKIGMGGEGPSTFAERKLEAGEYVIGAVNGDFFGGKPHQAENSTVDMGVVKKGVSKYNRTLFGIDESGKPFSGVIKYNGYLIAAESDTIFLNSFNFNKEQNTGLFNNLAAAVTEVDSGFTGYLMELTNQNSLLILAKVTSGEKVNLEGNKYFLRFPDSQSKELNVGDRLTLHHSFDFADKNIRTMIGGLPYLIRKGEIPATYVGKEGLSSEKFVDVNPRTAVGFNEDGTRLYLIAVDGRNPTISVGMPLLDMAKFMKSLGCYEAVNLDGGGSTSMTIRNEIANHPSDATGERPVHNILYLAVNKPQSEFVKESGFSSDTLYVKPGEIFSPEYGFIDKWGFVISDTTLAPVYTYSDGLKVTNDGVQAAENGMQTIFADYKGEKDTLFISVKGE